MRFIFLFLSFTTLLFAEETNRQGIICGVCKDIANRFLLTKQSMEQAGNLFSDYRIIIYENNSTDGTKQLLQSWQKYNPRVRIISEDLNQAEIRKINQGKAFSRINHIAAARNKLLTAIMEEQYDQYTYVIMADMDFREPWRQEILREILCDQRPWDAVFSLGLGRNGRVWDIYAHLDPKDLFNPILIGQKHFAGRWQVNNSQKGDWRPVYSSFGGLAIYKRDSLKGCRYDSHVTPTLDRLMKKWLATARRNKHPHYQVYREELSKAHAIKTADEWAKIPQEKYPPHRGIQLQKGGVIWISNKHSLNSNQVICEHIALHADMIAKGKGRLFVHPRLVMRYN